MFKNQLQLYIVLFTLLVSSCGKKLIYFQEKENSINKYSSIVVAKPENPKEHIIETGDILRLQINHTNIELTQEFSKYIAEGILVHDNGTIFLPYAGSIHIVGKTIVEAQEIIYAELTKFILNPTLELSLKSFRVTVLGEVRAPGIKNSLGDNMSIIQAISISGDLGIDANRSNIKVVRQVGDKKIVTFVDISSVDVFNSSSYYLKSNDIIYVETLNRRFIRENITYISVFATIVNTLGIFLIRF